MKMSTIRGMAIGMMLGSAACYGYSMMDNRTQRKLKRFANGTANKMMCKISDWLG